jgi:hypothetical protein
VEKGQIDMCLSIDTKSPIAGMYALELSLSTEAGAYLSVVLGEKEAPGLTQVSLPARRVTGITRRLPFSPKYLNINTTLSDIHCMCGL